MYRPFDWAPLAESDPLPGDPQAIRDAALHLRQVAATIASQVETIRRIGVDDHQKGEFAEELRHSGKEVTDKLETVRDRYARVSGYLFSWADELEELQRATLPALERALDAERMRQRDPHSGRNPSLFTYQTMPAGGLGVAPPMDAAEQLLADARRDLQRVLDEAAARDRYWGGQIGHAIDDKLTDGFWDHVHHYIEQHKVWVDGLTQTLGYVTTAVAMAAIAFPPLMPVAIGLTAANLVVHTVEFQAGEASLFDIALDIGALVGFGAAMRTSAGLEKTFMATRQAASEAASREAAAAVREGASESLAKAEGIINGTGSIAEKSAAQDFVDGIQQQAGRAGHSAAREVLEAPSKDVGPFRSFLAGSREDAHLINDTRGLLAEYSEDVAVRRAGAHLDELASVGRRNFLTAAAADGNDKFTMHAPFAKGYATTYNELKERFVMSGGPLE